MGDDLSEGRKSVTLEVAAEDLEKTDSTPKGELSEAKLSLKLKRTITESYTSLKKELSSVKDLDPDKDGVKDADLPSKKDSSLIKDRKSVSIKDRNSVSIKDRNSVSIKDRNSVSLKDRNSVSIKDRNSVSLKDRVSVKDSVKGSTSDKDSTSIKKSQLSASLKSTTSGFSLEEPVIEKIVESSQSKSHSSQGKSVILSVPAIKSTMSQKQPSEHPGKEVSFSGGSTKLSSKGTDYLGKGYISSNQLNANQVSEEAMTSTFLMCDYTNAAHKTFECSSNYISPWAKSSSKLTLSQSTTKADEMKEDFKPKCIPPWAKTLRRFYGMSCPDPSEDLGPSQSNLQEKIKKLMDKHSHLMLIKRGESRKQLILKPSEGGEMGTVKMTSKNTRYYMTPIPRDLEDPFQEKDLESTITDKNVSTSKGSDLMALTEKTSRSQAKKEVSNVLKSLYNSKKPREIESDTKQTKNQKTNCLKITPSKIRDYVNAQALDSDGQKLHEIIKIKKVPSYGAQGGKKPSSKYIINVPKSSAGDGTTVNKITVKEKRKIKIDSVEDVNENITEIIYNKYDSKKQEVPERQYTEEDTVEHDVVPYSKRHKTPTKTRTLEVTAEKTPIISDLLKKEKKDKDKILLIQYEKKSKPCKEKSDSEQPTRVSTQLLGIRQPCNEALKEMYLYGTETDGKKCKERITQVDDVSPTLREKVNLIFQELREMTFKPCAETESTDQDGLELSVSSKTTQHPSLLPETDAVSVQALPEVRSAGVQVQDSVLFTQSQLALIKSTTPSQTEEDEEESTSKLVKEPSEEVTDELGSSKEIESIPKKSLLDSEQLMDDIDSKKEKQIDVSEIDDTILLESDEKGISEERKGSGENLESQDKTQDKTKLEETEDKNLRDEKENYETDLKLAKDDHQEKKDQDDEQDQKLEEEIAEALLKEKQKDEALDDEETTSSKKEKDLYDEDGILKDGEQIDGNYEGTDKDEGVDNMKIGQMGPEGEKEGSHEGTDQAGDGTTHILLEDIRSYDFDPAQDFELRMINSSKFFHQKDSLRKLHWTEDTLYLERNTCPQLIKALAEIAIRQPEDPIAYLAHWIYKDYQNSESDEKRSVFKEHIEVAKGMSLTKKDEKPVSKKFSIRRYPMKSSSPVVSTVASETSNIMEENEIEALS